MNLSGYRWMWVIAMFDVPVHTKAEKRQYVQFRKGLLRDGFAIMQYSVYIRHAASRESAEVHAARVERIVPPNGEVRVLTITDKQMARMQVFWGKTRRPPEPPPAQLALF